MIQDDNYVIPKAVIIVIYVLIILGCFIFNLVVIIIVIIRPVLHTITSYLILSLSVADLLVGVIVVTLTLSHIIGLGWTQNQSSVTCVIPPFIELACVTASVYSLLLLCTDRYRSIVLALKPTRSRTIIVAFLSVWLWSFFYASRIILQDFLTNRAHDDEISNRGLSVAYSNRSNNSVLSELEDDGQFCSFLAEEDEADLPFRIADLVILFIIPVTAMVIIFIRIRQRLWSSTIGVTTNVRKKRAVIRFLAFDITIFVLCWLPFYLIDIITDTLKIFKGDEEAEELESDESYIILRFIFVLLAFCSSLVNPLLYAFFNTNFMEELWVVLAKLRIGTCRTRKVAPSTTTDDTKS